MLSSTSPNNILLIQRFFNAIAAENFTLIESLKNSGLSMTVRVPSGGKEALHVACEVGISVESLNKLIALGANVNATTDRGFTPLHVASQRGQDNLMIALIKAGASIEAISDRGLGTTPLQEAAFAGQLQAIKVLVAAGADTNYRERKYNLNALELARTNEGRIVTSMADISAAILGAEEAFIIQVSSKASEWQRHHVSQNQDENDYVARLLAIPFAELSGDQCFLKLQSALQEGYEPVKKNLAPLRGAMVKLMKQYNEAKVAARALKAVFADQVTSEVQTKQEAQEMISAAGVSIGTSIFSAIPPLSTNTLPSAGGMKTSIKPNGDGSTNY